MSKYTPLENHLASKGQERIPMSFRDIESVIQDSLPPSARKHRAWWSNNPSNSVITYAWLEAGFRTSEVNLESEKVTFVRADSSRPVQLSRGASKSVFGCLAGSITVAEGTDLTAPADEEWGKAQSGGGG